MLISATSVSESCLLITCLCIEELRCVISTLSSINPLCLFSKAQCPLLAQMLSSKQFLNKRKKRSPAQIKQLLHARQQIKATQNENHGLREQSLPSRTTQTETHSASVLASIKSRLNEAVEKLSVCTLEVHQQKQELTKKTTLLANANSAIISL